MTSTVLGYGRVHDTSRRNPEAIPTLLCFSVRFPCSHGAPDRYHSADVNRRGGSPLTGVTAGLSQWTYEVASVLVRNGADHDSRDDLGRVPLRKVSHGGQLVMAKSSLRSTRLLVNSGADVDVTDDDGWATYTQQRNLDIMRLRSCYLYQGAIRCSEQVSTYTVAPLLFTWEA